MADTKATKVAATAPPAPKKKLTVAELLALKGKRQIVLTTAFEEWEARAAEAAGVDMIVSWGNSLEHSRYVIEAVRRGAPNTLIGSGLPHPAYASEENCITLAGELRSFGVDIIYCSGLVPDKFGAMARQHIPCCGHVGYLPVNDTWLGGPRAVGKTAAEAKKVYDDVMALDAAGCIAIEMEVVPARVAAEITKRTNMLIFSMGSGPDCDGQFIFMEDIIGTNSGHYPRHSITYGHAMDEAVKALSQYKADCVSGAYPAAKHAIKIKDEEFAAFMAAIGTPAAPLPAPPPFKPRRQKLTVHDLKALKGQRQIVLTTAFDEWTARAAEAAGVDMIVSWGNSLEHSRYVIEAVRRGAPNTLIGSGLPHPAYASEENCITLAGELRSFGVDIIYCSGLVPDKFGAMARQHIPCCGHVGYLPVNDTWLGGPRAVGKTAAEAKKVYDDVMALDAAGCIAIEMEVVPARVAAEITKRTNMLIFSMGSGPDCDGQFIFMEDIIGTNSGHYPRHSITYGHAMDEAVKALSQYKADCVSGAYPAAKHAIKIKDEEFAAFMAAIEGDGAGK